MPLALHLACVLFSLLVTAILMMAPTEKLLKLSYLGVFLTLASGTLLVALKPSALLHTCAVGLVYLGVVLTYVVHAQRKLAEQVV
jgi:hypothetical protein